MMNSLTPSIPNRFDFLEIAVSDIPSSIELWNRLGFVATQSRNSVSANQVLMIQGRIRVLLTQGLEGTYQKEYFIKNGSGICAIGYHVDSAKKALHAMRQQKISIAQEFVNQETDEMFLQSSAVYSVADIRVIFVTRSGAPHDVLSPFAPGFVKDINAKPGTGVGLGTFVDIVGPGADKKIHLTFSCSDKNQTLSSLQKNGWSFNEDIGLELFSDNPTAQVLLHFKNS